MDQPAPSAVPVAFRCRRGRAAAVLMQLQQQGALRHARLVELYLRLHGCRRRAQAGTYEIAATRSARAVLDQLNTGRVVLEALTMVEGWSFAQLRTRLTRIRPWRTQLRGLTDAQLMSALGHPGEAAEGRFFPDTYRFAAGTSDRNILERRL